MGYTASESEGREERNHWWGVVQLRSLRVPAIQGSGLPGRESRGDLPAQQSQKVAEKTLLHCRGRGMEKLCHSSIRVLGALDNLCCSREMRR